MKTYLRTGAFYKAETPSLSHDLDITELFLEKSITNTLKEETSVEKSLESFCNCKNEIEGLNKRIDDLVKLVNEKPKEEKAKSLIVVDKKVAPKKSSAKKK